MQALKMRINQENRVFYFDFLRAIACIAVVCIHVAAIDWYVIPVHSSNWAVLNLWDSMSRWSVPVFFMISGALLLGNENKLSLSKLYKKNILRLLVVTLFWSGVYAAYAFATKGDFFASVTLVFTGEFHMWFMFTIICLYILTPIIKEFVKNEKIVLYFLLITFCFSFFEQIFEIIHVLQIPKAVFLASQVKEWIHNFDLLTSTEFLFYFLLGYVLHKRTLKPTTEKILLILGASGFVITFLGTEIISLYSGSASTVFYVYNTINVLLTAVGVFVFAKRFVKYDTIPKAVQAVMNFISRHSFGIYLSHVLVIEIIKTFNLTTQILHHAVLVPLIILIVFSCSLTISYLISKIPFLNKWIV